MKRTRYPQYLTAKLTDKQRTAIENLAETRELSLGEAIRELLDVGIQVRGLME
jgi:hypothetical protein